MISEAELGVLEDCVREGFCMGPAGVRKLLAEIRALRTDARRWWRADGTLEYLATAEEVGERRREAAARLGGIEQAVRDYHLALDNREHGGVAQARAIHKIEELLGLHWEQWGETNRRKWFEQIDPNAAIAEEGQNSGNTDSCH